MPLRLRRPDARYLRFERPLCSKHATSIPRPPLTDCWIELRMSHCNLLLAGLAARSVASLLPVGGGMTRMVTKGWVGSGTTARRLHSGYLLLRRKALPG